MGKFRPILLLLFLLGWRFLPLWGNVVIPSEIEDAGHWADAVRCMESLHYDLDSLNSAERMMSAVSQWHVEHPMAGGAGEFMHFVQTTVLPALDVAKPFLCAKLPLFAKELPLVALTEEKVRVRTDDGQEKELPWSALQENGALRKMCLLVLDEPSRGETERDAMLAMLFFSGHRDLLETRVPDEPQWRTLLHLRETLPAERMAFVEQWRALAAASAQGDDMLVLSLARKMLARENVPGRDALLRIVEGAGGRDLSAEAGRIVRGVVEMFHRGEYQAAFRELLYAKSRFDGVEYPERGEIGSLLQKALEAMPLQLSGQVRPESLLPWVQRRPPGLSSRQVMWFFKNSDAARKGWAPLEKAARLEWGINLTGAKTRAGVERLADVPDLPRRTRSVIRASLGLWKVVYEDGPVDWCKEILATKEADLMALAAIAGWLTGRAECCPAPSGEWTGTQRQKRFYLNLRGALLAGQGEEEDVPPPDRFEKPDWSLLAYCFAAGKDWFSAAEMREIFERDAADWPVPAGKLVWDWMLREREECLRQGDADGARSLVEWMLELRAPCVYRYHRQLEKMK